MMIRTVLIDDEKRSLETMQIELDRCCPEVKVIAAFSDPVEALKALPELAPDLVFLDIEMPWMNGFELLRRLDQIDFKVIFATAYDQFALKAFRFSAVDYLLKPIQPAELREAVDKITGEEQVGLSREQFQVLTHNLMDRQGKAQTLVLPTSAGYEFLKVSDIVRCEADSNYTTVFMDDGAKYVFSRTLRDMENLLEGTTFYRVHASHLINTSCILRVVKSDGGYIIMKDQTRIPMPKSRRDEFLRQFGIGR